MISNNLTLLHMTDFDGELHQGRFFYCNKVTILFGIPMFFIYLLLMEKKSMISLDEIRLKNENEKILKKVTAFNMLLDHLQVIPEDVLGRYMCKSFRDTNISKQSIFHMVVNNNPDKEAIDFLTKCGNVTAHQNDKRTYREYATELILGWLIEDAVVTKFLYDDVPAKLQGADCEREFLTQKEIDTTPDIRIGDGEGSRLVEVFCDWTNHWETFHKADLRDNKYLRLVNEKAILLGLSPLSGTGFIIDFGESTHGFEPTSIIYGFGGKSGYTTKEISKHLKPIDDLFVELSKMIKMKQIME